MFCYHLVLFQQVPLLHFQHLTAVVCPYGLYLGLQCFDGFFVCGYLPMQGGVNAMDKINQQKAELLYGVIDNSDFYRNDVAKSNRSRMNVPFQLADSALDKLFQEESFAAGLHALKGHRVVGGMRASIYNAMPLEGVKALTDFMVDFERRRG